MNSITPSTTKPVPFCVTLGRVHALRLEGDARTADLAPAMKATTDRLECAGMARADAVRAWKAVGLMRTDAAKALVVQVHVAWYQSRAAADVAGKPEAFQAAFPEALSSMLRGGLAKRVPKIHSLVERLAATEEGASKTLTDALAAFEVAQAAYVEARRKAKDATHAVHEARRCWHEAYRLSFMAVATRIGSARAAPTFFLPMAPHAAPPPVPEGGGGMTPVPAQSAPQPA